MCRFRQLWSEVFVSGLDIAWLGAPWLDGSPEEETGVGAWIL